MSCLRRYGDKAILAKPACNLNMSLGASAAQGLSRWGRVRLTEGTWDADDEPISGRKFASEVDFVAGRAFNEDLEVGDLVTNIHKSRSG